MALDKFRDPADPLWEQRVNQLEEGTGVGEVTSGKIAAKAVTPAKLGEVTWTGVSEASAELEGASGFNAAESASLGDGLIALRGASKVKAAGSIAAGVKLFKIANAPAKTRLVGLPVIKKAKEGKEVIPAEITTTGVVNIEKALAAEEIVAYDGIVFSA